jgi:MFS family permease
MLVTRRNIYFVLFAISGFSGLIYESIWTHYLKLFLGHAANTQTLELAIFMGGMALGSWICSKYSSRWKNLLFGYAVTEGIIGLFALLFHHAFVYAIELSYASILPQLGHPAVVSAFKWTLSALMILPQSVLFGMTFPLMSAGILRLYPEKPGRSVAMLYFTISIGAAIGVLASGFMLIRLTGLPGTIRIAGIIIVPGSYGLVAGQKDPPEMNIRRWDRDCFRSPNPGGTGSSSFSLGDWHGLIHL